jgi:predicted permease
MTGKKDRELDEEIRSHLEMAVRDRVERGESHHAAEAAARRELGNIALVKEVTREMWGWMWLERLVQDLRYGARLLGRNPGFTAVAVLSLALGIGANTALFQVINAVRLRALPVHDPDTLATIRIADMTGARGNFSSSYPIVTNPIWEQIGRDQQAFTGLLAWSGTPFNLAPGGLARRVRGLWVSGSFFDVLGVKPASGRLFTTADDRRGCPPRAVISHGFWQSELGGRPLSGATLTLDGHPVEILGVVEKGFTGVEVGRSFAVAVPICAQPALTDGVGRLASGTDWWLTVMGRLKPGWTMEQASAHLGTISPGVFRSTLTPAYPVANVSQYLGFRLEAVPGGSGMSGLRDEYSAPLGLLLAIAALVLVIACVNIANLMLARASAREREFAVRIALGASRARVIRQLLAESLLLAIVGAACGSLLASYLSDALVSFLDPARQTISLDLGADWRVLGFIVAVTALTCVLFGLAPALKATRVSASAVVRSAGRGLTQGRERFAVRRALVTLQIALSLFLLIAALLFTRTLGNLLAVDPGFTQAGVVVTELDFRGLRVPADRRHALRADVLARIRSVPGIAAAADVSVVPVSGNASGNNVWMETADQPRPVNALFNRVSDAYFSTLRIPLIAGRDFSDADTVETPTVAIVNESFVRMVANDEPVLGRRLKVEATPTQAESAYEIVGVVRDAKYLDLRQEPTPVVFLAARQSTRPGEFMQVMVRSDLPRSGFTAAMTQAVREVNRGVIVSFTDFEEQIRRTLVRERLMATLSGFFGLIAAALAVVGVYGVVAYGVTRRTQEIGVRIALGARGADVLRMILREALWLVAIGTAVGLGLALLGGRAAATLLFGLEPTDPVTLALAAGVLTAIAFAASYVPARAAARIAPMTALRLE